MSKSKPNPKKKRRDREPEEITLGEHVTRAAKAQAKPAKPKPPQAEKKPSKKESMEQELARLRREIKARDDHDKKGRKLAGEVQVCEADVDSCKAETAASKVRLAEANKRLAAHVRGEVPKDVETGKQQSMIPEGKKPQGKTEPLVDAKRDGADACKAGKPPTNPYKEHEPEAALWITGYLEEHWKHAERRNAITYALTAEALMRALLPANVLPAGEAHPKVKSVSAIGYHWLVIDGWSPTGVADCSFAVVQLVRKEDWRDLWLKTYGPAIEGSDANVEAKANREKGGPNCGRIVRIEGVSGDFVVAPREAAMVLVAPRPKTQAAAAGAAPFDAKAAAANDDNDDSADD